MVQRVKGLSQIKESSTDHMGAILSINNLVNSKQNLIGHLPTAVGPLVIMQQMTVFQIGT